MHLKKLIRALQRAHDRGFREVVVHPVDIGWMTVKEIRKVKNRYKFPSKAKVPKRMAKALILVLESHAATAKYFGAFEETCDECDYAAPVCTCPNGYRKGRP